MIVVLAGGTGAAKFIRGLTHVVPQHELAIIVNTGDDLQWWGLHVSPDIDTILYCLAGLLDKDKGWGVGGDTFTCRDQMSRFGEPAWFSLGDRDLAVHLYRSRLLAQGSTLSDATAQIAKKLGVTAKVMPMSDQPVRSIVHTPQGELGFQEFFVRERFDPQVLKVEHRFSAEAFAASSVCQSIHKAQAVIIAPSNPITSIGPILAVTDIAEALRATAAPVVAVSPIVGGAAVSGPAGKMMAAQGYEVSPVGVARAYQSCVNVLVADKRDEHHGQAIGNMGIEPVFTDTLMSDEAAEKRLAQSTLSAAIGQRADAAAIEGVR